MKKPLKERRGQKPTTAKPPMRKVETDEPKASDKGFILRVECPFCGAFVDVTANQDLRASPLREGCLAELNIDVQCGKCNGPMTIPFAIGLYRVSKVVVKPS